MGPGLVVLCLIVMAITYIVRKKRAADEKGKKGLSDNEKINETIDNTINEEDCQTKNFLLKTLTEIGCQYKIDNNNCINFNYEGETFTMYARNESPIIWIFNYDWMEIGLNDPNADYLKQAINKSNESCVITNLYTINEGTETINAHCRTTIYFSYHIPDYKMYLEATLYEFFSTQQRVRDEFNKFKRPEQNEQGQKKRVEIKGFRPE